MEGVLNYKDVLEAIKGKENHLLIANGFNYGLGVCTGYSDIFKKMKEEHFGLYVEAEGIFNKCNCDLELFLERMSNDISENNIFLRKYVCNKIKLDFMQALHSIVKAKIKNIYEEKNEGIYLLLREFTNYFTLNYDSFLYMLLLKYKKDSPENNALALMPTLNFVQEDLDSSVDDIYTEIKTLREKGELGIKIEGNSVFEGALGRMKKTPFVNAVEAYSDNNKKKWKKKDIERVVDRLLDEENRIKVLEKVEDGSKQLSLFDKEFVFDVESEVQNLFFLHGAFHIYRDGEKIKKITQETDKSLYNKLEDILNTEGKDIVCIFQSTDKLDAINGNAYLRHCYEKLSELSGNLVIIGSSLADNDNHIFNQINASKIENIFISSLLKDMEKNQEMAEQKFPDKKIIMFDAESISYEKIEEK